MTRPYLALLQRKIYTSIFAVYLIIVPLYRILYDIIYVADAALLHTAQWKYKPPEGFHTVPYRPNHTVPISEIIINLV